MQTLPELLFRSERRFGDRPAVAIRRGLRTQVWSYHALAEAARTAAARLEAAGLEPGGRVLTLAPNGPELVAAMFGVWLAGGVLVPLDLRTPPEVVARIRETTSPRLLIASGPVEGPGGLATVSPFELVEAGYGSLPISLPRGAAEGSPSAGERSLLAEIIFTSGTTGAPKGVMLTHRNILANVGQALEAMPIRGGQRLLSLLPLSHMLEQTIGLLVALARGATIHYATSHRSSAILAALQRQRIGLIVCVPEVLKLLLAGIEREVERRGRQRRWRSTLELAGRLPMALRPRLFGAVHRRLGGHLRVVLCGGAALDPELWRTWERLGVRVIQGYGATECAPMVSTNRLNRRLPGAVGWPVRGVRARLAPDGEILVRGPNVTTGYWRDEAATAAAFQDGWYCTGDVGRVGERGELRLVGRKKEMIVLADGRNVFPQDVEGELGREAAIKDCAVVGAPRAGGGEEVHAVLIPSGDAEVARAAVRRANTRLGPHQQVGGMTIWPMSELPRTPSLKVKRAEVLAGIRRPDAAVLAGPPMVDGAESGLFRLLARAAGVPVERVRPEADLALDLGLDSLARVELAVLLEEELGRAVSDEEMAEQRTVADLMAALERGGAAGAVEPLPAWPREVPGTLARLAVQDLLLFPLLRLVCRPRRVIGLERLGATGGPALLIANHTSHLDSLAVLATLPPSMRRRTAVAAAADYFFARQPLATFASLALGAFPFHRQGAVSASLAHCGDLADAGQSILIFPEGTRSPDGRLQPFKSGIGLLARELGLPVVPIHLRGLHTVLPKGRSRPRPGPLAVTIGEPLRLDPGLSNAEAAEMLEAETRRLAEVP